MKIFVLVLSLLTLSCNAVATDDALKQEFKKFFQVSMPEIETSDAVYIDPVDSDVLPVQQQPAHISVHIKVPGLKKLLILHGEKKYPDSFCKPQSGQTFVAGYNYNPAANISYTNTTMRVECSSKVIVWVQTADGKFYKTEKNLRLFNFKEQE